METEYREIIILRGIPGSGKSTYAEKLMGEGWKRLNKDQLRTMLNNYSLDNSDENIVHSIQTNTLRLLMRHGRNIVIDNTHTKQKYINDLLKEIKKNQEKNQQDGLGFDYGVRIKHIGVSLEKAIGRNKKRERKVMPEVIKRMHEQLHATDMTDKFLMIKDY